MDDGPTAKDLPSNAVLHAIAIMFGAAGDVVRLQLLVCLADEPRTVMELAAELARTPSLVSQQLRVLRLARLVRGIRDGRHVRYELFDRHARSMLVSMLAHVRRDGCA